MVSFEAQKLLILTNFNLSLFLFFCFYFWCHIEETLAEHTVRKIYSCAPFWVNFYIWHEGGLQLHSFVCGYQVFPPPFNEETIFLSLKVLGTLVKINRQYIFRFISTITILLHRYMSILMPVPQCFHYCIFVVSFKVRRCKPSHFVLHFQYCLDYSRSYKFEICLSIFFKRLLRIN